VLVLVVLVVVVVVGGTVVVVLVVVVVVVSVPHGDSAVSQSAWPSNFGFAQGQVDGHGFES